MTDINGVPIVSVCTKHALKCPPDCQAPRMEPTPNHPQYLPAPEVLPKNAIGIAQVAVELAPGATVFEMKLREPGIVRAVGFWLHTPNVLAPSMKGVRGVPMPLLWVECNPDAPVPEKPRVFAFLPSDAPIQPRAGYVAKYIATAMHERGAMHLFELVEQA